MKWAYLAAGPDQLTAEMWRTLLRNEGIAAVIRPGDTASFMGVSSYPCRVLVRREQLADAREVLEGHLGYAPR